MSSLKIHDPATGLLLAEAPADDAASVSSKYERARRAQPAWAATPLAERIACLRRFGLALEAQVERLAVTLTSEVGKPITQSRNEIKGLLPRIDFFVEQVEASIAAETVHSDAAMTERISHEPLGVV